MWKRTVPQWVLVGVTVLGFAQASCSGFQIERFFPEQVGPGVARLTVRNVATIMSQLSADTRCGFASELVATRPVIEGVVGDVGKATFTVENCVLDYGELSEESENCNGDVTSIGGRVVVTASKVVVGHLTGDLTTPVIPLNAESARVDLRIDVDDFEVRISGKDTGLVMRSGTVEATIFPHLGRTASTGACSIAGANLTLKDVTWTDGLVDMDTGSSVVEVEVPSGTFSAQIGAMHTDILGDRENHLEGSVVVWDSEVPVPAVDDEFMGLDPDYVREEFLSSFACTADLEVPVSYECVDLSPKFAQGSAQLLVSTFGNVVRLFDANTQCGFSSSAVLQSGVVSGPLGVDGGNVRYEVTAPCLLEFVDDTVVATDCNGKETTVRGRAWVTGTKVVTGINSGDVNQPIVPTSAHPGMASLSIVFEDFTIRDNLGANALTVENGTISGVSRPKTARDVGTGACSVVTPVARFENIFVDDASLVLSSSGRQFRLDVPEAHLDAQNGADRGLENHLAGDIAVGDVVHSIPVAGDPVLDPSYDAAVFDASHACVPNAHQVVDDEDCSFLPVLAEGVARLVVQTAGVIAGKVNSDDDCGFDSTWVLLDPWVVEGDVGEMGSMIWKIEECALGSEGTTLHEQTCVGGKTYSSGVVTVDATRIVHGERNTTLLVVDSIIPRDREAVTVEITSAALAGVVVTPYAPLSTTPKGVIEFTSGTLTSRVTPILGERESDPGVFDVPTPVAKVAEILLQDSNIVLQSAGKTFVLALDDVALHATNGSWAGATNVVGGAMTINGTRIDIGEIALDPAYSQAVFDAGYACTEDLLEVVPAN